VCTYLCAMSNPAAPRPHTAAIDDGIAARFDRLRDILRECDSVCVGYSGGVDSVFLAKVAVDTLGADRVLAVTGRSAAYPSVQRDVARECARRFGIPHLEIETDELDDPDYTSNPSNRCYYCKSELWPKLGAVAARHGLRTVLDGSNADDAHDYRPGFAAARENGVRSPLLEAGLTKDQVRALSRQSGLPTWDQPASPCLSSRLPYGIAVTPDRLRQIELAEAALRDLGYGEFRVRHHDDCLRLEVAPPDMPQAERDASAIVARFQALRLPALILDVHGYRRGALNEALVQIGLADSNADRNATESVTTGGSDGSAGTAAPLPPHRVAGFHGDIAVIRDINRADAHAAATRLRAAGFRYVAMDLQTLAAASAGSRTATAAEGTTVSRGAAGD
jgi:pyridinium-3,5-biscarboxylic acid mononucleotide sulfurtransferase